MVHDYSHLFENEPDWKNRGEALAHKTYDFTTFMHRIARLPTGALATDQPSGEMVYHYFCQSHNVLGMREEPFDLLGDVCGLTISPMPEANWCCGFGGSVSLQHPEISQGILDRKLDNLDTTGARILVTDNPGCIMHLRGGIDATNRTVEIRHTAEIIAERMRTLTKTTNP
jgi:Fe-S oxidoreductase